MCGMEIKWIEDSRGMDIDEFKALCEENKEGMSSKVGRKWVRMAGKSWFSKVFLLILVDRPPSCLRAQSQDRLACLMVTYPSTRAFFEDNILEQLIRSRKYKASLIPRTCLTPIFKGNRKTPYKS